MLTTSPSRLPLAVAVACFAAGVAALAYALSAATGSAASGPPPPPAPAIGAAAPTPAPAPAAPQARIAPAADPLAAMRGTPRRRLVRNDRAHVPAAWVAGFYPLYARAQATFGVNWLLIASIHRQETAFSTDPTTYRRLNPARCCAGPMQFNVTNGARGTGSTWERYRDAGRRARRPASYPNRTPSHPSVYDDFDAIMAAASLLADSGANAALDGTAWRAAYDYYGHDLDGIAYADEVVARAIGWSQRGFSINQPVDPALRAAVEAAWGAPARAALAAARPARARRAARPR